MSANHLKFYINGSWVEPAVPRSHDVINPATQEKIATISLGSAADVDKAAIAARAAFGSWSRTTPRERSELFAAIIAAYKKRVDEIAHAVTAEMGAPAGFAHSFHAASQTGIFQQFIDILGTYEFEKLNGTTALVREPIGVCGLITPWNVPVGAIVGKLAPALAAGCTVIVKPSEIAPLSPLILAEVLHDAGVPKGVFNLVNGDGAGVGQAICAHAGVDMISFTGSTRAGIAVAKAAADTVKRVQQELGGKSANIILPDADIEKFVTAGLSRCYVGGGQSCQAPTRMLVPRAAQGVALAAAKAAAEAVVVGDPNDPKTTMGPVSNQAQWDKIQSLIKAGIDAGATLVTGGLGRPNGLARGYYVKPTVFGDVAPDSRIAQEEIFGPVLSIIPYRDEAEAIEIANNTMYGLSGWVYSGTLAHAKEVALQMRTGRVYLNGALADPYAPFGGYKYSGNGREGGVFGLEEYLEVKALLGAAAAS
jgi:aldehyde dehydrogenase (NAD+)